MLRRITNEKVVLSDDVSLISQATTIILPGVGAFDSVMKKLHELNIASELHSAVIKRQVPFLGICVGMQILFSKSDEGQLEGLGWIEGKVSRFSFDKDTQTELKVPHMGWNSIERFQSLVMPKLENERFYFVHSFHAEDVPKDNIMALTNYGISFPAIVRKENIWGIQFHPEKSHIYGIEMFRYFLNARKLAI